MNEQNEEQLMKITQVKIQSPKYICRKCNKAVGYEEKCPQCHSDFTQLIPKWNIFINYKPLGSDQIQPRNKEAVSDSLNEILSCDVIEFDYLIHQYSPNLITNALIRYLVGNTVYIESDSIRIKHVMLPPFNSLTFISWLKTNPMFEDVENKIMECPYMSTIV